ncbi:MAG: LamG domain-containing protein [Planctomycetes bacterium]|nr:LamG domain-containing protein [Planctomycetota bacterium]
MATIRIIALLCSIAVVVGQESPVVKTILAQPGLVAFWDFREDAGTPRRSLAKAPLALHEMQGPIAHVAEGPFGHALKLTEGQWLRIPRADIGPLDLHGKQAQVSVLAWLKRERKGAWQGIAGVWDESRGKRQYCLFVNGGKRTDARTMTRTACKDLFQGHVSDVGGPTMGEEFCITYATSGTPVPFTGWQFLAMTYDAREVRLYRNGRFDSSEGSNPFPHPHGLFDAGAEGAEFTVGCVSVKGKPGNFFAGLLGGVAVFDRALTAAEVAALATATGTTQP